MKILVLGCNGMAGHVISLYFHEKGYNVTGFGRKKSNLFNSIQGDAKNLVLLEDIIKKGDFDAVINCIGILNNFAEEDKEGATFLNAYLPHFLVKLTRNMKTKIIHMSTDCVFSGKKGGYTEDDFCDGETFYDRSKALGEINDNKNLTLRNSIIGPDINQNGIGLLNWFMQQDKIVYGFTKAMWTGQTTVQLAKTMENALFQNAVGLYNMVPESSISKYELLCLFNKHLKTKPIEIIPKDDFFIDKSLIRLNREGFNYNIPDYETMIIDMKDWMQKHKEIYPHYSI